VQWVANEKLDRNLIYQIVSAGGRVFYVFDSAVERNWPTLHHVSVVSRDAFNGCKLWQRDDTRGFWLADGERLYTMVNEDLVALDGVTGETVKQYGPIGNVVSLYNGILCSASTAFDLRQARLLWTREAERPSEDSSKPVVCDGKVVYTTSERRGDAYMVCLDLMTGKELWRVPKAGEIICAHPGRIFTYSTVQVQRVIHGKTRTKIKGTNRCFSLQDGNLIWKIEYPLADHHGNADPFVLGDRVWVRAGDLDGGWLQGESWQSYDLATGRLLKKLLIGPKLPSRCFHTLATQRYILGEDSTFLDVERDKIYGSYLGRGACGSGFVPANGLLYTMPNKCLCIEQVQGTVALASDVASGGGDPALCPSGELDKGPAYGTAPGEHAAITHAWPTLRAGPARMGSCAARPPASLKEHWTVAVGGKGSSPVVAGGMLIVAARDTQQVIAFDATSGVRRWSYAAAGPVDSPPTITGNLAVFGCEDGWVYALRLSDGALAWRLRACPTQRYIVSGNRVASVWPVHGSVLVQDGRAYAVAGRHNEADGGLFAYSIDLATGQTLWKKRIGRPDSLACAHVEDTKTASNNILASDGRSLYLDTLRLDAATGEVAGARDGKSLYLNGWDGAVVWGGPHGFIADNSRPQFISGHGSSDWSCGAVRASAIASDGKSVWGIVTLHGEKTIKARPEFFQAGTAAVFCARQTNEKKPWDTFFPEGTLLWSVPLPKGSVARSVIKTADLVFVACKMHADEGQPSGLILAYDPASGQEKSRNRLAAAPLWDGLAAAGQCLYVSTEDGRVRRLGPAP